jgi:hypothetical protein
MLKAAHLDPEIVAMGIDQEMEDMERGRGMVAMKIDVMVGEVEG